MTQDAMVQDVPVAIAARICRVAVDVVELHPFPDI
jgi:hypothetical protein